MRAILLSLLIIASGCAHRRNAFEFGAGFDAHIDQGKNPQSAFTFRNEPMGCSNGGVIEFQHNSAIFQGWPFNKDAEDLTNQLSFKYRIVF